MRTEHLTEMELYWYLVGELLEEEEKSINQHLKYCPECRQAILDLKELLSEESEDDTIH